MRLRTRGAGALLACAALSGCGLVGGSGQPAPAASDMITVASPAFREGGTIPGRYTCEGAGTSPPLRWTGMPSDAAVLALVVDDPDAPGGTYVHWVVFNIDPATTGVAEGVVPAGGQQGRNSAGSTRYAPPCPPSGTHRYRFTVYALPQEMPLDEGAQLKDALADISKRATASGRLTAVFGEG
ncbi:MAG: YbhB/YbcL family Raf kinase inhibitor-like protein [Streptosporangiales bacterium]|nr:YbhB/YbcL family Raf kinase inhibitor-like protein [Streptosporangiales bacterium]